LKLFRDDIKGLVLFIAALQWVWSVKNIFSGPLKADSGIVSWALLVFARLTENTFLSLSICVFQVCAFGFVFALIAKSKPWQSDFARLAKKYNKSQRWAKMFTGYLLGHTLFWAICAREFYVQWELRA